MFDYLQKYNNLPKEIRDKVSAPKILALIDSLEKEYGVYLAVAIMKVMVKEIEINNLDKYFALEFKLDEKKSKALANELIKEIFSGLSDYFAPEKEKAINNLARKAEAHIKKPEADNSIEARLDIIIKQVNINFGSELLLSRFRYVLKTYLSGIRDKINTREALIKSINLGGLGFDFELANNILAILEKNDLESKEKISLKPPVKISLPEDKINTDDSLSSRYKSAGVRDVQYDFSSLKNKIPKTAGLDLTHELPPPVPQIIPQKEAKTAGIKDPDSPPKFKESKPATPRGAEKTPFAIHALISGQKSDQDNILSQKVSLEPAKGTGFIPRPSPSRLFSPSSGKIKMEDIKFEPKVMGPIDELRYMNLINFRRLDKDPFLAKNIIKEKIDLLDEEYRKRMEGIMAWRASPLNKLYLEIGSLSISSKKTIDAIIEERKKAGQEYLTAKEMEAIIELNRELRF